MPDLMLRVMDNLKPHMIGELAPLLPQPLIDCLYGRNGTASRGSKEIHS
jgi:hypothetical protein